MNYISGEIYPFYVKPSIKYSTFNYEVKNLSSKIIEARYCSSNMGKFEIVEEDVKKYKLTSHIFFIYKDCEVFLYDDFYLFLIKPEDLNRSNLI